MMYDRLSPVNIFYHISYKVVPVNTSHLPAQICCWWSLILPAASSPGLNISYTHELSLSNGHRNVLLPCVHFVFSLGYEIISYLTTAILTARLFVLYMNVFFMVFCVSLIAIASVLCKDSTSFHISFHLWTNELRQTYRTTSAAPHLPRRLDCFHPRWGAEFQCW